MNTLAPPEDSRGDHKLQPRSPHLHRRKLSANVEIQSQEKKSRIPEWPEEVKYNLWIFLSNKLRKFVTSHVYVSMTDTEISYEYECGLSYL